MPIDSNNDAVVANVPVQPTPQPTPYYDQGTSTPPNGGQVTSVSPAEATSGATGDDSQMVSNGPTNGPTTAPANGPTNGTTATPAQPIHPSVQKAGIIHEIAQALGGGPTYRTSIDANTGAVTRTPVPLSKGQIGLAIAMEALSGSLAGLGAKGTNATGQAAAAGLQQGQQIAAQRQQAQQQEDQNAQQGFENQQRTLAQRASTFEANSRAALNASQAQNQGMDAVQKMVALNKPMLDDAEQAGIVDGHNLTHDDLLAGMQSGQYSALDQLGPIDGFRVRPDGVIEPTHAIIQPDKKLPLSTDAWNDIASWGIKGWQPLKPGTTISDNFQVPARVLMNAQEQVNALHLASNSIDNVRDTLAKSSDPKVQAMAENIPDLKTQIHSDAGPGLSSAVLAFQRYESHNNLHGMDTYEALQKMAEPSIPDPNHKGQSIPNPDARFAGQVAQAFGGWDALKAYHEQTEPLPIKNRNEAISMLSSSTPGSRKHTTAQGWLDADSRQAVSEAAAKKSATSNSGTGNDDSGGDASTLVDQIGTGHIVPDRIGYLLSRNPALLEQVSQKYPGFDSSKAASYPKIWADYTSGKTSIALAAGDTALQHLKELSDLNTPASHIYGTPAYTSYHNKLDTLADELGKFYGASTLSGIEDFKKTLGATLPGNRAAAIRTQAQSMASRLNSFETKWRNAAPSAVYQKPLPGISDQAKYALSSLDPAYKGGYQTQPQPPQGATMTVRGNDGKLHWSDGKNDLGVAQ